MNIPEQDWNATQRRDGTWAADDPPTIPEQAVEAAVKAYVAAGRKRSPHAMRLALEAALLAMSKGSADVAKLRRASTAVYLAAEASVADELSTLLKGAADEIERLRAQSLVGVQRREDVARTIWNTGLQGDEPTWDEAGPWWREEYLKKADAVLALPHTGRQQEGEVDRILKMSEAELAVELAKDGETIESAAAKGRAAFERAKAQVDAVMTASAQKTALHWLDNSIERARRLARTVSGEGEHAEILMTLRAMLSPAPASPRAEGE